IVPDIIRAVFEKNPLVIRTPQGIRPWQHVLDAVTGYLLVAERLMTTTQKPVFEGWNFGPDYTGNLTVQELLDEAKKAFPTLSWKVEPLPGVHEAKLLTLDSTKARRTLNWNPRFDLMNTVKRTFSWYGLHYQNMSARELCLAEIDETLKSQ
ncbi:MAG: CDP-glucose 4,6-dehydratase, partial [Bdellovibrionales bacterium]